MEPLLVIGACCSIPVATGAVVLAIAGRGERARKLKPSRLRLPHRFRRRVARLEVKRPRTDPPHGHDEAELMKRPVAILIALAGMGQKLDKSGRKGQ